MATIGVRATLLEVPVATPGDLTTCHVAVRNTGAVPDQFRFEVQGRAAAWATGGPDVLDLAPGAEGVASIELAVPRSPWLQAGAFALDVRVRSRNQPGWSATAQGVMRVAPFADVAARLEPAVSHTRRSAPHVVTLENRGNEPVRATITVVPVDPGLVVGGGQPLALAASPGRSAAAHVVLRCRRPRLWGSPRPRRFEVLVTPTGSPSIALAGELCQAPVARGARAALAALASLLLGTVLAVVVLAVR